VSSVEVGDSDWEFGTQHNTQHVRSTAKLYLKYFGKLEIESD